MRVPYRKPGKFTNMIPDPIMTTEKFETIKNKLEKLKKSQPKAVSDVRQLSQLGDFSENVEYQLAKRKLRGINFNIIKLGKQLDNAKIITTRKNTDEIEVGNTVILEKNNKKITFKILGSTETNPEKGIISYTSPTGSALLGHKVGDVIKIKTTYKEIVYKILEIKL